MSRWATRARLFGPQARAGGALAVAAAAAAIGCGKVTPDDLGDAATTLTVEQGCAMEAQEICGKLDACASFWVQLLYGDATTCVSRLTVSCKNDQMVSGTTRTPADMAACAQSVKSASCPDLVASKFPAACQVKPGSLMNGVACGSDWQCESTYCNTNGQACGACGPRAAANGNCTSDDGCVTGLVCANDKCVAPGGDGASCDPTRQPCRSDLYCTSAGLCAPHVGAGQSCADTDRACDLFAGTACNAFNKICETVGVGQSGGACGIVDRTLTLCVALDACSGATLTQPGVCASPAADGEACGDSNSGHNCIAPATCVNGVCRLPSVTSCQ